MAPKSAAAKSPPTPHPAHAAPSHPDRPKVEKAGARKGQVGRPGGRLVAFWARVRRELGQAGVGRARPPPPAPAQ
eukprot:scaffold3586_cov404-Prasinococcus_capsulatus_cf.AAC.38